jgi:hypothetical protein
VLLSLDLGDDAVAISTNRFTTCVVLAGGGVTCFGAVDHDLPPTPFSLAP